MLRLLVLTSVGLTLFAAVVGYQPRVEPARSRAAEALAVRAPTPAAVGLPRDGLLLGPGELAQPGAIRTLPGQTGSAAPLNVRTRDVDLSARIQTDRLADGGDQYAYLVLRSVNAASY